MQPPLADFLAHDPFVIALAQVAGLVLLIRFLDVWEREPLWLVGALVAWGMTAAPAIALAGNSAASGLMPHDVEVVWGSAVASPVIEEVAKGLGLLAAVYGSQWAVKRFGIAEFDGPVDGVVFGATVGIGFAFAENVFYAHASSPDGSIAGGVSVLHFRQGFLGLRTLGHGVYTACLGAGIGMATWSRTRTGRLGFPLLGLAIAIFLHALWNGLQSVALVRTYGFHTTADALSGGKLSADLAARIAATNRGVMMVLDVWAYSMAILFFFALYFLTRWQRQILVDELGEEVRAGVIGESERRDLVAFKSRARRYLALFRARRVRELLALRRFHAQLVDLAFWKWRLERVGGDLQSVDRRRARVRALRAGQRRAVETVRGAP